MTNAEGEFVMSVPADCSAVLVEAESVAGDRWVWLVPVQEIDLGRRHLFSEHNRRH
jgi:hypothetical protein